MRVLQRYCALFILALCLRLCLRLTWKSTWMLTCNWQVMRNPNPSRLPQQTCCSLKISSNFPVSLIDIRFVLNVHRKAEILEEFTRGQIFMYKSLKNFRKYITETKRSVIFYFSSFIFFENRSYICNLTIFWIAI